MNVTGDISRTSSVPEVGEADDEPSEVGVTNVAPTDVTEQPPARRTTEIACSDDSGESFIERSATAIVCRECLTSGSGMEKSATARLPKAAPQCATASDVTSPMSPGFEPDLQVSYERSPSNGFIETAVPIKGIEPSSMKKGATSIDSTPSWAADSVVITRRRRRFRCLHHCCRHLIINCRKTSTNVLRADAVSRLFPAAVFLLLVGDNCVWFFCSPRYVSETTTYVPQYRPRIGMCPMAVVLDILMTSAQRGFVTLRPVLCLNNRT